MRRFTFPIVFAIGAALPVAGYLLAAPATGDENIEQVESRIDRIEQASLQAALEGQSAPDGRIALLGKLILYDRNLSVNRNEACATCHMPEAGYTGPVSALNATTVSYPGSVRARFGNRKPQSIAYSSYAPALHYNPLQGDFVGGAFWDMRASGIRLDSPDAEQAQGPPITTFEMGLSDTACMVRRLSQSRYRFLAEQVWGAASLAIKWPADADEVCASPGPPPTHDPYPVHLDAVARVAANRAFDQIAEAVAAYEATPEINAFSSKYDLVMAGKAQFTADESAGYALFRSSRTHCNECHRDGGPGEEPLFTDFTASNLGLPRNAALAFFLESYPDKSGYAPNPAGRQYFDNGVGGFVAGASALIRGADWQEQVKTFAGRFKVPTLRNVDKRPRPDFVKAYMHNGYLKSLKEVVHFYNTRDSLPRCEARDPGEKTTCWPAPEYPATMNRKQLGNLGLTDAEENQLVAFLKTLSDGPTPPAR